MFRFNYRSNYFIILQSIIKYCYKLCWKLEHFNANFILIRDQYFAFSSRDPNSRTASASLGTQLGEVCKKPPFKIPLYKLDYNLHPYIYLYYAMHCVILHTRAIVVRNYTYGGRENCIACTPKDWGCQPLAPNTC